MLLSRILDSIAYLCVRQQAATAAAVVIGYRVGLTALQRDSRRLVISVELGEISSPFSAYRNNE